MNELVFLPPENARVCQIVNISMLLFNFKSTCTCQISSLKHYALLIGYNPIVTDSFIEIIQQSYILQFSKISYAFWLHLRFESIRNSQIKQKFPDALKAPLSHKICLLLYQNEVKIIYISYQFFCLFEQITS